MASDTSDVFRSLVEFVKDGVENPRSNITDFSLFHEKKTERTAEEKRTILTDWMRT